MLSLYLIRLKGMQYYVINLLYRRCIDDFVRCHSPRLSLRSWLCSTVSTCTRLEIKDGWKWPTLNLNVHQYMISLSLRYDLLIWILNVINIISNGTMRSCGINKPPPPFTCLSSYLMHFALYIKHTVAMERRVRAFAWHAEGWVFESQLRHT